MWAIVVIYILDLFGSVYVEGRSGNFEIGSSFGRFDLGLEIFFFIIFEFFDRQLIIQIISLCLREVGNFQGVKFYFVLLGEDQEAFVLVRILLVVSVFLDVK